MSESAVRRFIEGKTVSALVPETGDLFGSVTYGPDGSCHARFADRTEDIGRYGFDGQTYWTRYKTARGGVTNHFFLIDLGEGRAQAYHDDGRRAYLLVSPVTKD
ncbi:MAG: hypothetical protein NXI27_11810 [Alphaproteobacteria bacterium]|nr:hypothetical protein [Alphaproteobacteria bacterium]